MKRPLVLFVLVAVVAISLATFLLIRADHQQLDAVDSSPFPEDSKHKEPVAVTDQVSILESSGTSETIAEVPRDTRVNERVLEDAVLSESLSPEEESERRKTRVRTFLSRNLHSDQDVKTMIARVRVQPENSEFAEPIRKHLGAVLAEAMPEKYKAGELYWECGSELCFVEGIPNDAVVDRLFNKFGEAVAENGVETVMGNGRRTDKGDWVFFVIGENYAL